jgi:hypothetical protein
MKKIIITLSLLVFFCSCYKDKGNYTYNEKLNGIKEIKNIKEIYKINRNGEDILKITPKLVFFNKKTNKDNYTYQWVLQWTDHQDDDKKNEKLISTKKDLHFNHKDIKNLAIKSKITFVATNSNTTVSKTVTFNIEFRNNYKKGILILHESENNKTNLDLSIINIHEEKFTDVDKNIYKALAFRDDLLQEGQYKATMINTFDGIVIFTNNHSDDYGAVLNKSSLNYKYSIKSCFRSKNPPDNLKFIANIAFAEKVKYGGYYLIIDGKVYEIESLEKKKNPYINLGFQYIENENTIDYYYTGNDSPLFHSASGKLYISNSLLDANFIVGSEQNIADFLMEGKCFFIFEELISDDDIANYHILVKNNDKVKDYKFTIDARGDEDKFNVEINSFTAPDLITEKTFFIRQDDERYTYIAQKNTIYKWNYDVKDERPEDWYTFNANIEITCFEKYNDYMIVCTYDKSKQTNGASLYKLNYNGQIIEKKENICGKIKSIVLLNPK